MKIKTIIALTLLSSMTYASDVLLGDVTKTQVEPHIVKTTSGTQVVAKVEPLFLTVEQSGVVKAQYEVYIHNSSNKVMGFQYIYHLCVDNKCITDQHGVNVEPGQTFRDARKLERHVHFKHMGDYLTYARTELYGDMDDNAEMYNKVEVR